MIMVGTGIVPPAVGTQYLLLLVPDIGLAVKSRYLGIHIEPERIGNYQIGGVPQLDIAHANGIARRTVIVTTVRFEQHPSLAHRSAAVILTHIVEGIVLEVIGIKHRLPVYHLDERREDLRRIGQTVVQYPVAIDIRTVLVYQHVFETLYPVLIVTHGTVAKHDGPVVVGHHIAYEGVHGGVAAYLYGEHPLGLDVHDGAFSPRFRDGIALHRILPRAGGSRPQRRRLLGECTEKQQCHAHRNDGIPQSHPNATLPNVYSRSRRRGIRVRYGCTTRLSSRRATSQTPPPVWFAVPGPLSEGNPRSGWRDGPE